MVSELDGSGRPQAKSEYLGFGYLLWQPSS
jgi:hypothetical protein